MDNLRNLTDTVVDGEVVRVEHSGFIPNPSRDSAAINNSIIAGRKAFLRGNFDLYINVKDGPASSELLHDMTITYGANSSPNGIEYGGKRVVVSKDKGRSFEYSTNKSYEETTAKFKTLLNRAKYEHEQTAIGSVDKKFEDLGVDPTGDAGDDVLSNATYVVGSAVDNRMAEVIENARAINISEQEVRELAGSLDPKGPDDGAKIAALEKNAGYYKLKEQTEEDPIKKVFYKSVYDACLLKADYIRLEAGEKPRHSEVNSIIDAEIENNDLTKLKRFKKWAKDNLVGASALAISIAGIVTTVVIGARKAIVKGGGALGSLGKAIANLAKQVGPLLAGLLNVVAAVLKWGAAGLAWLAGNLWILVLALVWLAYDQYKQNKR